MLKASFITKIHSSRVAKIHSYLSSVLSNTSYSKVDTEIISYYALDKNENFERLKRNMSLRNECVPEGIIDILSKFGQQSEEPNKANNNQRNQDSSELLNEISKCLPNDVHPILHNRSGVNVIVKQVGCDPNTVDKNDAASTATDILCGRDLLRCSMLKVYCGERSYFFMRHLAKLEHSLVLYSIRLLLKRGFKLVSVPDILPEEIIQRCGMNTKGQRTQVYKLSSNYSNSSLSHWCLSGTAEMGLCAYLHDKCIQSDILPFLLTSLSRCYRAEISKLASEKGIYRVHEFTKVEMFAACSSHQSEALLDSFVNLQEDLFRPLQLNYNIIDISTADFGLPTYRKYDVESWMPGLKKFGEISSASNCTDYQSRRLNIRNDSDGGYVHTVNGTACAVPRMIVAIAETLQDTAGKVCIPEVLNNSMDVEMLGSKRGPRMHRVTVIPKHLRHEFLI